MEAVALKKENAVKYRVQGSQKEYLVFTVFQRSTTEHWEYDGQQVMENLGFMPAFESDGDGGELTYTRFYHVHTTVLYYLPDYAGGDGRALFLPQDQKAVRLQSRLHELGYISQDPILQLVF